MIVRRLFCLITLAALIGGGCQRQAPPPIDQPVSIVIGSNRGKLVAFQNHLLTALSVDTQRQLGWRIRPQASLRLIVNIDEETITSSTRGDLGIPERYRLSYRGSWQLTGDARFTGQGSFTTSTSYATRLEERHALERAAAQAGRAICADLDRHLSRQAAQTASAASASPAIGTDHAVAKPAPTATSGE
ncbi:MAG: hypothetical protein ACYTF0_00390 [Planctomycetota bacterium]|jgi:hypothetical protein